MNFEFQTAISRFRQCLQLMRCCAVKHLRFQLNAAVEAYHTTISCEWLRARREEHMRRSHDEPPHALIDRFFAAMAWQLRTVPSAAVGQKSSHFLSVRTRCVPLASPIRGYHGTSVIRAPQQG